MNIAIFGDSFANGESDMRHRLAHLGLTRYLTDDGHFVINFSRQGNANNQTVEDLNFSMRQNEHIKPWDMAIVFQTEPCRESEVWIQYVQGMGIYAEDSNHTLLGFSSGNPLNMDCRGGDVRKVERFMAKRFYAELSQMAVKWNIPIYLVGGTVDTSAPEEIDKFVKLKCVCQSVTNLCVNGEHTIEEPVTNFVFPFGTGWKPGPTANEFLNKANKIVRAQGMDSKRHFIELLVNGESRYKLMEDNPEYFAPKENLVGGKHTSDHPNRHAYKKLFNHLKSIGIV